MLRRRTKNILEPSLANTGMESLNVPCVSRRTLLPSRFIRYALDGPSRSEINAMVLPSGQRRAGHRRTCQTSIVSAPSHRRSSCRDRILPSRPRRRPWVKRKQWYAHQARSPTLQNAAAAQNTLCAKSLVSRSNPGSTARARDRHTENTVPRSRKNGRFRTNDVC